MGIARGLPESTKDDKVLFKGRISSINISYSSGAIPTAEINVILDEMSGPGNVGWQGPVELRSLYEDAKPEQENFAHLSQRIAQNYLTFESWLKRLIYIDPELAKKADEHLRSVQKLIDQS